MLVGYTTGVFDLFHRGHVLLLRRAAALCDRLVVGVSSDEASKYKGKTPVICYEDRAEVVQACRYVDCVVPQYDHDKFAAWERINFNVLFVGDDWYGSEIWEKYQQKLDGVGVKVIYLPYSKGVSSTLINETLKRLRPNSG